MCPDDLAVLGGRCQTSEAAAFLLVAVAHCCETSRLQQLPEFWLDPERMCLVAGLSCRKDLQSGRNKANDWLRNARHSERPAKQKRWRKLTPFKVVVYGGYGINWQEIGSAMSRAADTASQAVRLRVLP